MAFNIIVTEKVQREIERVLDYLYLQDVEEQVIADILKELQQGYRRLEENPAMYALSENHKLAAAGYRKMLVGRYVILYTMDEGNQAVLIMGFFHQSQDYPELI